MTTDLPFTHNDQQSPACLDTLAVVNTTNRHKVYLFLETI